MRLLVWVGVLIVCAAGVACARQQRGHETTLADTAPANGAGTPCARISLVPRRARFEVPQAGPWEHYADDQHPVWVDGRLSSRFDTKLASAIRYLQAGNLAYNQGRPLAARRAYARALSLFRSAHSDFYVAQYVFELAGFYFSIGDTRHAIETLRVFLRYDPDGDDPKLDAIVRDGPSPGIFKYELTADGAELQRHASSGDVTAGADAETLIGLQEASKGQYATARDAFLAAYGCAPAAGANYWTFELGLLDFAEGHKSEAITVVYDSTQSDLFYVAGAARAAGVILAISAK
ncbi:MAG TPA: hypothetical protein VMF11_04925 [Candidatus Baltobacteraceae bacterium]|nr:hypothetical protein [Candidatus Baltobacteraceae bacterium]